MAHESLSPAQQEALRQFAEYLRTRDAKSEPDFLDTVDEFMAEHPQLLDLLSK